MEKAIPVLLLFLFVAGIASPGSDRYPWGNFRLVFNRPHLYYVHTIDRFACLSVNNPAKMTHGVDIATRRSGVEDDLNEGKTN